MAVGAFPPGGTRRIVLVQVKEGRFEPREVKLGERSENYVEVREGVTEGEQVEKGQTLLLLEAMKMEHTLNSPCDGVVQSIPHPVGDQVTEGTELIHFSENDDSK